MKKTLPLFVCAAAALLAPVPARAGEASRSPAVTKDIVDTAVAAGSFKTLVAAVKAAGLVDTLKGAGPFTVFAPTDEAFARLAPGTLDSLLKDPAALKSLLTYHVVAGRLPASTVAGLPWIETAIRIRKFQGGQARDDTATGP